MSKRKPGSASKHARRPEIAAKAQRITQVIVKRPKDSGLLPIEAVSTESVFEHHDDDSKQDASPVENPVTAVPDLRRETITHNDLKPGFEFSSATAKVRAYQAKLLEMAQADMQFAFEFTQRLAAIRSPIEFPSVIAEFTSRRISMFRKYSKEISELSTKRLTAHDQPLPNA